VSVRERVVRGTRDEDAGVVDEAEVLVDDDDEVDELRRVERRAGRPSLQEASAAAAAAAVPEAPDEEEAAADVDAAEVVLMKSSDEASLSLGSSALQLGHALCFSSHLRIPGQQSSPSPGGLLWLHEDEEASPRWNQCLQPGSCVTTWPSLKSSRQMVQVRSVPGAKHSEMHVRCARAAATLCGFPGSAPPPFLASASSAVFSACTNSDFSIKPVYFTPCRVSRRLISDTFKVSSGTSCALLLVEEELAMPLEPLLSSLPSGSKKK